MIKHKSGSSHFSSKNRKGNHRKEPVSSKLKNDLSIIGILKSFGIDLQVTLNYLKSKDNENGILGRINDHLLDSRQIHLVEKEDEENHLNIRNSIIGIRFKCLFNHLEAMNKCKETYDIPEMAQFWGQVEIGNRVQVFDALTNVDRRNCNRMKIDIDLRFKSFSEVIEYLNLGDVYSPKSVEDEILSQIVEILDVDHEKKQVYICLKSSIQEIPNNPSRYYMMGKIDGTESCFILNLTRTFERSKNLNTIDKIYEHFTPQPFKDRIYKSGKPNLFHDCKQVGIYRVLIGCFFHCITMNLYRAGYSTTSPYDYINQKRKPSILRYNTEEWFGDIITTEMYWTRGYYGGTSYGGKIDTGFYTFHLKPMCRFICDLPQDSFFPEIYHFVYRSL